MYLCSNTYHISNKCTSWIWKTTYVLSAYENWINIAIFFVLFCQGSPILLLGLQGNGCIPNLNSVHSNGGRSQPMLLPDDKCKAITCQNGGTCKLGAQCGID